MNKIAIVGKPNVGKSTLFNRLIRQKKAIVENVVGVTRDRIYGEVNWLSNIFEIIDTGGLTTNEHQFQKSIRVQVNYAIDEASIILFMVSNKEGINSDDYYISKLLKKHKNKKVILIVNKQDYKNNSLTEKAYYSLGFGKPFHISSEHGIGIGDLLSQMVSELKNLKNTLSNTVDPKKFCIIGRPNVGKSTLVNTILNDDRVLVSPIAHTTRDSIDCSFTYNKTDYVIIDTAGIRRKGKITDSIERYSVMRALDAVERSKTILLVLDASEEFNEQDEVIGGIAHKANIPTIIVVNKWDKVSKESYTMNEFTKKIRTRFKYLSWAPIIFISAKDNKRIKTVFETFAKITEQIETKVNTSLLNEIVLKTATHNPPSMHKGGRLSISYATQVNGQIPTFVIFTNDPKHLHFSYARFIENTIRTSFGIDIIPITVYYKDKNSRIRGIK